MDALALLCNLHADGPETLESLRRAGCSDLTELLAYAPDDLAKLIEVDLTASRRLLTEARGLEERIAGPATSEVAAAEEELADVVYRRPPEPAPRISNDALDEVEDALGEVPDEREIDFSLSAEAEADGSHPVIQAVLETWRELDDEEPAREDDAEPERVIVPRVASAERDSVARPLAQCELEGLPREACARLADAGLTTVEELIAGDPLAIAKAAGLPYTRVMRAQFLARKKAAVTAPAGAEPAAGPFA